MRLTFAASPRSSTATSTLMAASPSTCTPGYPSIPLTSARNPSEPRCSSATINSPDELLCGWRHQCWLYPTLRGYHSLNDRTEFSQRAERWNPVLVEVLDFYR